MSYLERVMGIEPTLFAWEAKVLPLNYTRNRFDYRSKARNVSRLVSPHGAPLSIRWKEGTRIVCQSGIIQLQ